QPRKIYLGDHLLLLNHDIGGVLQRRSKVHPGKQRAVVKNWIGQPMRIHLGQFSEEKTENNHGHKRLNDSPGGANGGLLVANLDVAPDKEVKQLASRPQLLEVDIEPPVGRDDAQHRLLNGYKLF